jgi:DNA-binding XRE family transcriptional regulator
MNPMLSEREIERLEARGYTVGDYGDLHGLDDEERAVVELELAMAHEVRHARARAGLTQQELAKRIGSSQSRITKIETAAPGVSLDLAFRALFAAGGPASLVAVAKEVKARLKERAAILKRKSKKVPAR